MVSRPILPVTLVDAVIVHRDTIDAEIERVAPAYPVVQLARIDRALLRSGMGELLHCPATPTAVAISEWVELARTYSGESARRLLNGVLGRVAREQTGQATGSTDMDDVGAGAVTTGTRRKHERDRIDLRATQEDRRGAARRR